ncbi:hypothetical protein D3C87_637290 [compost metagenome]
MTNEKILIVKFESFLPAHEAKIWEANGWEVKYELSPIVREFIDHNHMVVDRTGSISNETLHEMAHEVDYIMSHAFPSPESFRKAGEYLIPLDFTDNISKDDMDRFLAEISEITGDAK